MLQSTEPILVGGKKYTTMPTNEIKSIIPTHLTEMEYVSLSCRSLLIPCHGINGTLYRTGEHILIRDISTATEEVIRVTGFFSLTVNNINTIFVQGEHFPLEGSIHIYSSSQYVIPSSTIKYANSANVLNKVMLYPDPDNLLCPLKYAVINYKRQHIPVDVNDVIVPVFVNVNDMVLVVGTNDEIWHAYVVSVDHGSKTCMAYFYVQVSGTTTPLVYLRESHSRTSRATIEWSSIIDYASGTWEGSRWIEHN